MSEASTTSRKFARIRRWGAIQLFLLGYGFLGVFIVFRAMREIRKPNPDIVILNWLALALLLLLWAASMYASRRPASPWPWEEFGNLRSEFAGALVLSVLLFVLVTQPAQRRSTNEHKQQLIREMRSPDLYTMTLAVDELDERGWLFDGTLQGADLANAALAGEKISGADLHGADLHAASIYEVDLHNADLRDASLYDADLHNTNLNHCDLHGADLHNANLVGARLENANLSGADLRNANLHSADLENADLTGAIYDAATVLPDGSTWSSETDVTRFTDPAHPSFWRFSTTAASPAQSATIEK